MTTDMSEDMSEDMTEDIFEEMTKDMNKDISQHLQTKLSNFLFSIFLIFPLILIFLYVATPHTFSADQINPNEKSRNISLTFIVK